MDEEKFKEFIAMLAAANMKREQDKTTFKAIAQHVKMWYDCFREVGFSDDQAFTLTNTFLHDSMNTITGGFKNG